MSAENGTTTLEISGGWGGVRIPDTRIFRPLAKEWPKSVDFACLYHLLPFTCNFCVSSAVLLAPLHGNRALNIFQ